MPFCADVTCKGSQIIWLLLKGQQRKNGWETLLYYSR